MKSIKINNYLSRINIKCHVIKLTPPSPRQVQKYFDYYVWGLFIKYSTALLECLKDFRSAFSPILTLQWAQREAQEDTHVFIHINFFDLNFAYMTMTKQTPSSWALLQKPPVVQSLKEFQTLYGTRRFIAVFTIALHWFLSSAKPIQSTPLHPISVRSVLILPPPISRFS
jgi:hypothetical protein